MGRQKDIRISRDEIILTERCRLRYPQESDIPHIWSASQTPGFNDGLSWDPPSSIAEINEPFRRAQASWDDGDDYGFTIESRESDEFLGWVAIHGGESEGAWSIGYWIHPTQQGHGYAAECARAIVEFGFSRLRAKVITACHATWNTASAHVLQRAGMTYLGRNPKGYKKNDEWVESCDYEIRSG